MKKKILTLTALSAILVASNAQASGFHLKEQSVSGLGTAFAGSSSGGQDISASYFNPAVLTRYKGSQIVMGATYVAPTAKLKYAKSSTESQGSSSDVVSNAVVPNFYASKQLNDDVFIGVSFNAPFGLITKYDDDWVGRNHGTLSDLKTYTMTPMLAYKMDEKMSMGIGAQIQHVTARLRNGTILGAGQQGSSVLEGDTTDAGFVFGAMYEWREDTRFGAGYRSRIHHKLKGNLDVYRPDGSIYGRDLPISAELTTPAVASFGVTHDLNKKVSLMAEFQRTYWSVFDELRIKTPSGDNVTPEKWKNTNFYSIGATYQLTDEWKLRGGLGFDKSAVKKEYRTPRIPDSNRNWYSIGAQYKPSEKLAIDMGYTFIRAAKNAKVNLPNESNRGTLQADYKAYVHIVGVGVTYNF